MCGHVNGLSLAVNKDRAMGLRHVFSSLLSIYGTSLMRLPELILAYVQQKASRIDYISREA